MMELVLLHIWHTIVSVRRGVSEARVAVRHSHLTRRRLRREAERSTVWLEVDRLLSIHGVQELREWRWVSSKWSS